jgi:hypothetical protein
MLQRLQITERDLAILHSLSVGRYLTVEALEWLHWPGWAARWQAAQQAGLPHKPARLIYSRLKRMRELGMIHRIVRMATTSIDQVQREHDVYCLAEQGALVLARMTGQAIEDVYWEVPRIRSFLTLTHSSAIGRFYAALRAKVETMQSIKLAGWTGDHVLARNRYDRIAVRLPNAYGGTKTERLPVLPDATFWIVPRMGDRVLFFVEVDRDRPLRSWREKIRAYEAYAGSRELQARYGVTSFVLLTATVSEQQRRRLMTATAEIHGRSSGRYLFTCLGDLHPTTIGAAWHKIAAVTSNGHAHIGGHGSKVAVETVPYVLFD